MRLSVMKMRRGWKLAHRWIGLTLGGILVLAAFTGALMTLARPLDEWLHADLFRLRAEAAEARGPVLAEGAGLMESIRRQLAAEFGPTASLRLRLPQEADESLRVQVSGPWDGTVFFDPRSAAELGRRKDRWTLVNLLFELHATLLMGEAGKAILALASLAYLLLLMSGLLLWWPTRWRDAWNVRWRGNRTRTLFDLHRVGGALLGLLIAVSVVSGAYLAWRPLAVAVSTLSAAPARLAARPLVAAQAGDAATPAAPLDLHLRRAQAALPGGRVVLVQLAASRSQPVRVRLKLPDDPHPLGMSSVLLHAVSAQVLAVQRWNELDAGTRAYVLMYPLHIGKLGGPWHMAAVGLLGLALAGYGVSGIWLWWRRRARLSA